MDDIIVRHIDMPTDIKGMTLLDDDGNYNVYINDRLSHDMRLEVYEHEIEHIKRNDHYNVADIREIEASHKINMGAEIVPAISDQKLPAINENERRRKRIDRAYREIRKDLQDRIWELETLSKPRTLSKDEFIRYIAKRGANYPAQTTPLFSKTKIITKEIIHENA